MNSSKTTIPEFLIKNGWQNAIRTPLAGDASSRRYERLTQDKKTVILMDSSSDIENLAAFVRIDKYLIEQGYSAPEILAVDLTDGLLLLEDFGDNLIASLATSRETEEKYYRLAIDFLIDLASCQLPGDLAQFDDKTLLAQGQMFVDWYYSAATGSRISSKAQNDYQEIWTSLFPKMHVGPNVLVLRDFHAENLIYLEDRSRLQRLGLLDFQDALQGPALYDLVSLLEDVRRDISPDISQKLFDHFVEKSGMCKTTAQTAYAILAVYRNLRIAGIFIRLSQSQDKSGYLQFLPRLWHSVDTYLVHPELSQLNHWFDENLPQNARDKFLKGLT